MRKKYLIPSTFLIIVLVFNFSPLAYLLKENYTYSNYNGDFRDDELGGKGGFTFGGVLESFDVYKKQHKQKDTTLTVLSH